MNHIIPLPHLGVLKISGPDAGTFLQGQLTTHVLNLKDKMHQLTAFCNRQGRVLALMDIYRENDAYFLIIPVEIIADIQQTLHKYIVFSKAVIENVSDIYRGFAQIQAESEGKLIQFRSTNQAKYMQYWGPIPVIDAYIQTLNSTPAPMDNFLLDQMQALIPFIGQTQSGKFLPHPLGLVTLGVIDFKKGCFVGQEIIARMQYRTEVKKHLVYNEMNENEIETAIDIVNKLKLSDNHYAVLQITE
jgi:tRNA-modifying protein YgfZ